MYPDRKRARRTVSVQCVVAMQSTFQDTFANSMAVLGLLGGESVMVHRRAFAVVH